MLEAFGVAKPGHVKASVAGLPREDLIPWDSEGNRPAVNLGRFRGFSLMLRGGPLCVLELILPYLGSFRDRVHLGTRPDGNLCI